MKASSKAICRLSLYDYGSMWIEARPLKNGFSVFVWDNEVVTKPKKIGTVNENYTWTIFADFLMSLKEGFIVTDNLSKIEVEGENGLVADCLRMAWAYHELGSELLDWFLTIDDDVFSFINAHFHVLDNYRNPDVSALGMDQNSDNQVIQELIDLLRIKVEKNCLELLKIYGLERNKGSIFELIKILKEEDQLQIIKKEEMDTKVLIPFVSRVEEIANLFSDEKRRIGLGMSGARPSERTIMRTWLEDFVVNHGYMPDGTHEVDVPFLGGRIGLGTIDFSNLPRK